MPVTKVTDDRRTIIQYTAAEFQAALGLPSEALAVYPLDGNIEVVVASQTS